jgi:hypothetical protein
MTRVCSAFLSGVVLLLVAGEVSAQEKLAETPYYPLQVGNTWRYKIGENKFRLRVTRHEKVGDVLCARVEMMRNDKVVATEHFAVTSDGVYRQDLEDLQGEKHTVQTPKPPILVLKLPPKAGDTWKVDSRSEGRNFRGAFKIGEAEVKVPAGSYKAITVTSQDLEVNALRPTITTYFASGVGMVKQTIEEGPGKIEIELEQFEPGGK